MYSQFFLQWRTSQKYEHSLKVKIIKNSKKSSQTRSDGMEFNSLDVKQAVEIFSWKETSRIINEQDIGNDQLFTKTSKIDNLSSITLFSFHAIVL